MIYSCSLHYDLYTYKCMTCVDDLFKVMHYRLLRGRGGGGVNRIAKTSISKIRTIGKEYKTETKRFVSSTEISWSVFSPWKCENYS